MEEDTIEVFMDDFSVVGDSFNHCLSHFSEVKMCRLQLCAQLGKISLHGERRYCIKTLHLREGIEVNREKVEVIERLPPPISVKGVRSFPGHVGFYRRFIKDFSKIAHPL